MTTVEIPTNVVDAIVAHARAEAPNECCGLLIGANGQVDESVPVRNVLESCSRYRVDPEQHFAALRRARGRGAAVIGAYHSHPHTAAEPSERDVEEAYDPDLLYVIVSLRLPTRPEIRAYRIRARRITEIRLALST